MDTLETHHLVTDPQSIADFKGKAEPDWCPGCGDFGVLNSLRRACVERGIKPHELLTISGIGCSSNLPGYFNSYGYLQYHLAFSRCSAAVRSSTEHVLIHYRSFGR